jgi:predicted nucleic acid-binding protein
VIPRVIHLDTSYLIPAGVPGTREDRAVRRWRARGETLRVSSIAWTEYLCGPVSLPAAEDTADMLGEPVAFGALDATLAAQLFNASGRRRGSLQDCMIAAVAIRSGASLATNNALDFRRFASHGLTIARA